MPTRPGKANGITEGQVQALLLVSGLVWGTVELLFLGARPVALTFISGVLLSVPGYRIDKARKALRALSEDRP